METYTYHSVRIPQGWKIEGIPPIGTDGCSFPEKRTLSFLPETEEDKGTIAHEAMHARTSEKLGVVGLNACIKAEEIFGTLSDYIVYSEIRSYVYSIHFCMKHHLTKELDIIVKDIAWVVNQVYQWPDHAKAAEKVIGSHIWERANQALRDDYAGHAMPSEVMG